MGGKGRDVREAEGAASLYVRQGSRRKGVKPGSERTATTSRHGLQVERTALVHGNRDQTPHSLVPQQSHVGVELQAGRKAGRAGALKGLNPQPTSTSCVVGTSTRKVGASTAIAITAATEPAGGQAPPPSPHPTHHHELPALVLVLQGSVPLLLPPLVLGQLLEVQVAEGGGGCRQGRMGEGQGAGADRKEGWAGAEGQSAVKGSGLQLRLAARPVQLPARGWCCEGLGGSRGSAPLVQGPTNPLRSAWQRPRVWAPLSATISWSLKPMLHKGREGERRGAGGGERGQVMGGGGVGGAGGLARTCNSNDFTSQRSSPSHADSLVLGNQGWRP